MLPLRRAIDGRVPSSPGCPLPIVIATPADLVYALFHGNDVARTDAAWRRLVKVAHRVSPGDGEDLAQDWARWLLEQEVALKAAQTLQHWGGLETSLRQHGERRRRQSSGLEEHPSPETEQLRDGLRKLLAAPPFAASGRGHRRTYRLERVPAAPLDPAHLRLTFDVSPSDHDDRARTLVSRSELQRFAVAWLSRPETPSATLSELVEAAAQAGGHPFPADRLERNDDHDAPGEQEDPAFFADVGRLAISYLKGLPVRRLRVAVHVYGHHLLLEEAAPRLGVGKSTVGNEAKAFAEGLREALAPVAGDLASNRASVTLVETILGGPVLARWAEAGDDAPSDDVWNALAPGRFLKDER
jgi:hypothetical protein